MGLFSVLSLGTNGMQTAQTGLDLAGQNIANADVEGYSRKRMNMTAAYRYDGSFGQMGFGTDVINIQRMRNTYIDDQIRRQNQEVGYAEEIDNTFQRIENVLTEPSDTGVQYFLDSFFDSWQNLANNPADLSARTMVKASAQTLTDVFHNISGELRDLRQTRNDEISDRVNKVNGILQQIYNFNGEIAAVEISEQNANDSRDRRDQALKELAKLIDIDTSENALGQVTISTSGNIVVSPAYVQNLEVTTSSFTRADGTNGTDIGLRFSDSKRLYTPTNGQIKGLLDSRDNVIPEIEAKLNAMAVTLVEKINEVHTRGFNLNGFSGNYFFEQGVTGASDITLLAEIESNVHNIAAATGGSSVVGVPQNLVMFFGNAPTQILAGVRNVMSGSVVVNSGVNTLTEGVDYSVNYAMGTIQMLNAGYDGNNLAVQFSYNSGDFKGQGDNSNAVAIGQIRQNMTMNLDALGNPTNTFTEYYSSFIGKVGLDRNSAASTLKTRNFLIEQYQTQQDSISAVSLDEEMTDIIKFQHSFQAAARIITTTEKMLEILMSI